VGVGGQKVNSAIVQIKEIVLPDDEKKASKPCTIAIMVMPLPNCMTLDQIGVLTGCFMPAQMMNKVYNWN
jgi:hypothetical protein